MENTGCDLGCMSLRQIIFTAVGLVDALISTGSHGQLLLHPHLPPRKAPQMIQNLVIIPFVSPRWYKPHSSVTVANVQWLLHPHNSTLP